MDLLPPPDWAFRPCDAELRLRLADELLRVDVLRFAVEPVEVPLLPIKSVVLPLPIKPPLLLDELELLPVNEVTLPIMELLLPLPEELLLLLDELFDDCCADDSVTVVDKIPKAKAITDKKQNSVRITNLISEKRPKNRRKPD